MEVKRKKTSLYTEKVAMHKFVQGFPPGTHPVDAARLAQEQFLPVERRQEVPNLSIAARLLKVWREAAERGQAIIVPMPMAQVAAVQTAPIDADDEVLEADQFVKLRSMLKPGLYLVRIE